jgi:hypothetical protein
MINNIVTMRRVEFLNKYNMEEDVPFPEVEEEEDAEEVWLNVIPVEKKDTNLGNVLTEKEKEKVDKHTLLKNRRMWKKKQLKEERAS